MFTPVLAADSRFGRLFVSTADREIGRRVFVEGGYETGLFRRAVDFACHVSGLSDLSGRAVLEIGANIGTTSLLFVRWANAGRVFAYEPVPSNLALLRAMVAANGLHDAIEVRGAAVSDRIGSAVMELSQSNSGEHQLRVSGAEPSPFHENSRATIDVALTTVDEEVRSGRLPLLELALVWIDVQGQEGAFWRVPAHCWRVGSRS